MPGGVAFLSMLLLAGSGLAGQPVAAFDAVATAPARFDVVADHVPAASGLTLREVDDPARDGERVGDMLLLSRPTLATFASRQELDGVLAILIAEATGPDGAAERTSRPGLGDYLGAVGHVVAAGQADLIDGRDTDPDTQARYDQPLRDRDRIVPPRSSEPTRAVAGTPRGRRILRLIRASGSCSGATLDALDRLGGGARERSPLAYFAGDLRHAFGALAMPPDRSCTLR